MTIYFKNSDHLIAIATPLKRAKFKNAHALSALTHP